ncbi:MAG: O-acetylhomoserine aminocarboxypropyltransferase [Pseudomonadota bacterium]
MSAPKSLRPDTLSLHAGQQPDPATGARAVPIYQTTSFVFSDHDEAGSRFDIARSGHVYSRISNPTVAVLEERMAALEDGVGAVATASGMAAIHIAIATLMGAGGHIVAARSLYGGTHNLLAYTLPRFGIETTFVDPRDPAAFASAITDQTRLVFAETIANPRCEVLDIAGVAEVAHGAGLPLAVDATLTTPHLIQPLQHGADIAIHSLTKFIGGHGIALGGVIVDAGRFEWESVASKFPTLCEPYEGFHGLDFSEEFGPAAFILRARREGLRDFGAAMSADTASRILQGVETLPLRMQKHVSNAMAIAEFLEAHEAVASVAYPGLASHPDHDLASRLYPRGSGAVLSFEINGGREAGRRLIEGLELFSHLANVGDAKSLVIHPASTTHARMDDDALRAAGISESLVRLSVGLEDPADLIADLSRALHRSQK